MAGGTACGSPCAGAVGKACGTAACPGKEAGAVCEGAGEEKLSATAPKTTKKKNAPIRKLSRPQARRIIRAILSTSSSIPNLSAIPCCSNTRHYEKGTATWTVPPRTAMTTLVRPMASSLPRIGALRWLTPQLRLRLGLRWLLLLLLFPARRAQRTNIGPHLLPLFRRQ